MVLVDCPSTVPSGGWQPLVGFVNGGGRVVMSFWDWDGSFGEPDLLPAFQVALAGTVSLTGKTLFDSGTSDVFAGVSMPNADWHGHWGDDGDQFTPLGSAVGLAHVGSASAPVLVLGNEGRTIAGPLFDEAGGSWLADGSGVKIWENNAGRTIASFAIDEASDAWLLQDGVQLWRNLMDELLGHDASCRQRPGALGLDPLDLACAGTPFVGETWTPTIDTTPLVGKSTQSTILAFGLGGPTEGSVVLGYELLALPPYVLSVALGDHAVAIPPDPELVGLPLTAQGARIESAGAAVVPVLTNAVDLLLGL